MKVFVDANVLFSASNDASNIHHFLRLLHKKHRLLTSQYAHMEAERNILLKRPQWQDTFLDLASWHEIVADAPLRAKVQLTEKDRPILGAAIAAGCHYLLTGDKRDFGHLYGEEIEGVKIVSTLMLAEIVLGR